MAPPLTKITLEGVQFAAPIGCDAWGRAAKKTQPVNVSMSVRLNLSRAEHASDNLTKSLDYSQLASLVLSVGQNPSQHVESGKGQWDDALQFHEAVYAGLQKINLPIISMEVDDIVGKTREVSIQTVLPVGTLGAGATATWSSVIGLSAPNRRREGIRQRIVTSTLHLADIKATTVIGVKDHEKVDRQTVVVSLTLKLNQDFMRRCQPIATAAHRIVHDLVTLLANTNVLTVEALVEKVWNALQKKWAPPLRLKVLKPDAIAFVGGAGVELEVYSDEDDGSALRIDERRGEMDMAWLETNEDAR